MKTETLTLRVTQTLRVEIEKKAKDNQKKYQILCVKF